MYIEMYGDYITIYAVLTLAIIFLTIYIKKHTKKLYDLFLYVLLVVLQTFGIIGLIQEPRYYPLTTITIPDVAGYIGYFIWENIALLILVIRSIKISIKSPENPTEIKEDYTKFLANNDEVVTLDNNEIPWELQEDESSDDNGKT